MDLKATSLSIGGTTPTPLSAYPRTPRPMAPGDETPRASGGMADGITGGNYAADLMAGLPNNSGPRGTEGGAAAAAAAFEANGQ